ncbi:MAG TPA: hypothetical protein VN428_11700 [Bryobacteraceae bacterium]|nr:hypothetical protein [Bryobacteraceae bacterium]
MKSIFVSNLDSGATEDSIRALFVPHGAVDTVNLVTDTETGHSRGFAFVEMGDTFEATDAILALDGTVVGGFALAVAEARPRLEPGGIVRERRVPRV